MACNSPPSAPRRPARLFHLLSSTEIRKRTRQALRQEIAFAVVVEDGTSGMVRVDEEGARKWGDKSRAKGFSRMLGPNVHKLPDMEFAMLGLAEVRRFVARAR